VLLGRGGSNYMHDGNEQLRRLAHSRVREYQNAGRKRKGAISREVLQQIQSMEPAGRFLLWSNTTHAWEVVAGHVAREKVRQSLCDALAHKETNLAKDNSLRDALAHKERNLAKDNVAYFEATIKDKDDEIALLKASLKNSKPIDIVDSTDNDTNLHWKDNFGEVPKSNLALQLEQGQAMVQVKQENMDAKTALELEDVREDLDIANDLLTRQTVFTDFLQSKIDDLASLAAAGGVDTFKIASIRGRLFSSGL